MWMRTPPPLARIWMPQFFCWEPGWRPPHIRCFMWSCSYRYCIVSPRSYASEAVTWSAGLLCRYRIWLFDSELEGNRLPLFNCSASSQCFFMCFQYLAIVLKAFFGSIHVVCVCAHCARNVMLHFVWLLMIECCCVCVFLCGGGHMQFHWFFLMQWQ